MSCDKDDLGQLEELPMSDEECADQPKVLKPRHRYYSPQELWEIRRKPGCETLPSLLSSEFVNKEGYWDPSLWFDSVFRKKSVSTNKISICLDFLKRELDQTNRNSNGQTIRKIKDAADDVFESGINSAGETKVDYGYLKNDRVSRKVSFNDKASKVSSNEKVSRKVSFNDTVSIEVNNSNVRKKSYEFSPNRTTVYFTPQRPLCPRLTGRGFRTSYREQYDCPQNDYLRSAVNDVIEDKVDSFQRIGSDSGEPEWNSVSASDGETDVFDYGNLEDAKNQYNNAKDQEIALNACDVESQLLGCEPCHRNEELGKDQEKNVDHDEDNEHGKNGLQVSSESNGNTCENGGEMTAFNNLLLKFKDTSEGVGVTESEICSGRETGVGDEYRNNETITPVITCNSQDSVNRIFNEKVSRVVKNGANLPKLWNSDKLQGLTEPKTNGLRTRDTIHKNQGNEQLPSRAGESDGVAHNFSFGIHSPEQNLTPRQNVINPKEPTTPLEIELLRENEILMAKLQALQRQTASYEKSLLQVNLEKQLLQSQLQMHAKNLMEAAQGSQPTESAFRNDKPPEGLSDQQMQARNEAILRLNGIRKLPNVGTMNLPLQNPGNFIYAPNMPNPMQNVGIMPFLNTNMLLQQQKIAAEYLQNLQARGAYGHN